MPTKPSIKFTIQEQKKHTLGCQHYLSWHPLYHCVNDICTLANGSGLHKLIINLNLVKSKAHLSWQGFSLLNDFKYYRFSWSVRKRNGDFQRMPPFFPWWLWQLVVFGCLHHSFFQMGLVTWKKYMGRTLLGYHDAGITLPPPHSPKHKPPLWVGALGWDDEEWGLSSILVLQCWRLDQFPGSSWKSLIFFVGERSVELLWCWTLERIISRN